MGSGYRQRTRTTATAAEAPDASVPRPRPAPPVESAAPDITPVDTTSAGTGPIPLVAAPAVDPTVDTGPMPAVPGPAPTATPPAERPGTPMTHPCRCGHDRDAHEHFRRGTDCASCDCARFRQPGLPARLRG